MKTRAPLSQLCAWFLLAAATATFANTTTDHTWSGATNTNANDSTNWVGLTPPPNDGTANLIFGSRTGTGQINFTTDFSAYSLSFNGAQRYHWLTADWPGSTLNLGSGGIQFALSGGLPWAVAELQNPLSLNLQADQIWNLAANTELSVNGPIKGAFNITKTGSGQLYLSGYNTEFSGNLAIMGGHLVITEAAMLGTGAITLGDSTSLQVQDGSKAIANAITLGGNNIIESYSGDIQLNGSLNLLNNTTNLTLYGGNLWANGLLDGPAEAALNLSGDHAMIFNGTTSANIQKITADGAGMIFASAKALPASLQVLNGGYLGVAANGLGQTALTRLTDRALFDGTIGFDTDPTATTPTVFDDTIDLSGFTAGHISLGSASRAILSNKCVITPWSSVVVGDQASLGADTRHPIAGMEALTYAYYFGNGGGVLQVQSALTGTADVVVNSNWKPLTVYLQGANTFAGRLSAQNSLVVLDSASALPLGSSLYLENRGYIGQTENWAGGTNNYTASNYLSRFTGFADTQSIIGFDSADLANPRVLADDLDLSSGIFADGASYLGTATAATLNGAITVGSPGTLSLAAVNGGHLTINSNLTTAHGVQQVTLGLADGQLKDPGTITLNGINDYTGGTTINDGITLRAGSDHALGTGDITIGHRMTSSPGLAAGARAVTLANNILVQSGGGDWFSLGETGSSNDLTLTGTIGSVDGYGGYADIDVWGNGTLTLAGDNTFGGGLYLYDNASLVVTSNTGTGTGRLDLANGMDATFTSSTPTIGYLTGGAYDYDGMRYSTVKLQPDATLRLTEGGDFNGHIAGENAALIVGNGENNAALALHNSSTYDGGTIIRYGSQVKAAHDQALGTGAVTLMGASLWSMARLVNPIVFSSARRSTLGGVGTYAAADGYTINQLARLSPGMHFATYYCPVGTLNFETALTLAPGGIYDFNVQNPDGGAGCGYDTITASSLFLAELTGATPFTIEVSTLDANASLGALEHFDAGSAYSWQLFASGNSLTGFDPAMFTVDSTNFLSPYSGTFAVSLGNDNMALYLNYLPAAVPEPSTWVLLLTGAGAVLLPWWRRRRS